MLCPSCRSQNSPAALVCHNCGAVFDRETAQSEREARVAGPAGHVVALRAMGFVMLVTLLLSWPVGSWLGRKALESRSNDPVFMALSGRYDFWKQAHGLHENVLMDCYAPDAVIISMGRRMTYNELLQLAREVRKTRIFSDVQDLQSPQIVIRGNKVEIKAMHRYGHSGGTMSPLAGDRRLIWEKRNGRWLIVEDQFPSSYTPVK